MASTYTHGDRGFAARLLSGLGHGLSSVGQGFVALMEAAQKSSTGYRCAQEAAQLMKLSDEELARIGLKRDDIVQYAFRRYTHRY